MCVVMASEATARVLELRMVCRFPEQIVPANTPAVHPFGALLCGLTGALASVGRERWIGSAGQGDSPGLPGRVQPATRLLFVVFRLAVDRRGNRPLSVVPNDG